jgi:hypothetical protein
MKRWIFLTIALILCWCGRDGTRLHGGTISSGVPATPSVLTSHWDNSRGNWNPQERILTPANVTSGHFGRVGTLPAAGGLFNQAVFAPGILTAGGQKDLIIAATMANEVYAFDANNLGVVWQTAFGGTRSSYPAPGDFYNLNLGCVATPAIDITAGKVYALCPDSTSPSWIIHILNLGTGAAISTITVSGQVVGTGDNNFTDNTSGSNLLFYPFFSLGRCSLTLANGNVYVSFGSSGDHRPWHGWIMGYSTTTLLQTGVWCSTPNNYGGALWFAGGGPAVDQAGNVYVVTGNGTYDGITNFADSVVKLRGSDLAILDWFTPSNQATLESNDEDLASARAMILPNGKLLVAAKDFNVYVIDSSCMGHLQGSSGCSLQNFKTTSNPADFGTGSWGGAFGMNTAFLPISHGPVYAYAYNGATLINTPLISSANFGFPGAHLSLASNGISSPILWMSTCVGDSSASGQAGTLRAYNPATMTEYWNSDSVSGDTLGTMAKFSSPLIANGRVFIATNNAGIAVYGMGAH